MSDFKIRPYKNQDWSSVLQEMHATMNYHMSIQSPIRFHHSTDKLLSDFLHSLTAKHRTGKGRLLVAENDQKQVVGFIYGELESHSAEDKKCMYPTGIVDELFVADYARGQGLAQKLMSRLEDWFKSQKCELIFVKDVHFHNTAAQNLYKKLGYEVRVLQLARKI